MVKLENYSKSYGKKEIIKNLNLDIYEGEFLTFLGSSGCGKTTILRSISGIDEVTSGRIYIDDEDITNLSPAKRHVNTLFQNYALFPHMTVEQNIGFGLKVKGVKKSFIKTRVNEMLDLVQLVGYENRKPAELSGGEQQRVSIARGLINNPKVLLLEEPLSALDLKLRKQMQVELKLLQKKTGITFIYVTHNQEEALTMSDRIVLLHNGEIEQLDTPRNIYRHPKTKYVADFIGDSNIFDGIVVDFKDNNAILEINNQNRIMISNQNYQINDKISIVFRPENFKIIPNNSTNCIKAVIRESIYDGSFLRLIMSTPGHADLKVNVDVEIKYTIGEEVYLSWDEEEIIVIKDDGDEQK